MEVVGHQNKSEHENIEYARAIAPYTVNIHVFNWKGKERYPLSLGCDVWNKYLGAFDRDKTLLLEFMPDDSPESLAEEAETLRKIINEADK